MLSLNSLCSKKFQYWLGNVASSSSLTHEIQNDLGRTVTYTATLNELTDFKNRDTIANIPHAHACPRESSEVVFILKSIASAVLSIIPTASHRSSTTARTQLQTQTIARRRLVS